MDLIMGAGPSSSDAEIQLRRAVAEFFEVDEGEVGPSFSLQGRRGQGSIARAALDSLIRRRAGLTVRSVYLAQTYGELEAELVPRAATAPPVAEVGDLRSDGQGIAPISTTGAVRCGVDIELIDHLPRAADCWEEPFYRDHFAPAEIAYCLLQETPAMHFTARWCVKEALKKCDGTFLTTAMKDIEVVPDGIGAPFLVHHAMGGAHRLPHAISLSHTSHAAVAVVVDVKAPAATGPSPLANHAAPAAVSSAPSRGSGSILPTLLSFVALSVALGALVRTFWIAR
jgi:phosphopantetheine--protein transferase-like protein